MKKQVKEELENLHFKLLSRNGENTKITFTLNALFDMYADELGYIRKDSVPHFNFVLVKSDISNFICTIVNIYKLKMRPEFRNELSNKFADKLCRNDQISDKQEIDGGKEIKREEAEINLIDKDDKIKYLTQVQNVKYGKETLKQIKRNKKREK